MHNLLCSVAVGASVTAWALASHAAASAEPPPSANTTVSRLEALKSDLLDITPGLYVSPLLTGSYAVGTTDVGPLSFDFDGYFVRAGAAVGYQERNLRLDLEPSIGFAQITIDDDVEQIGGRAKNDILFLTFTANVYYDFPIGIEKVVSDQLPAIKPYLGAGMGGIYLDVEDTGDDLALVSQAMAGVGIRVTPRSTFDLGYRLAYLPRVDVEPADFETLLHAIEVKLRYRF
jgi:opacity protein-like surface antigen